MPGLNIFIGDNASGKTTVLRGIKAALSSFFTGYSDSYTKFLGLSKDDFSEVIGNEGAVLNAPPVEIEFNYSDMIQHPQLLNKTGIDIESKGHLKLETEKAGSGSRTKTVGIKHLKNYATNLYHSLFDTKNNIQSYALPLLASFSTEDIHSSRKIDPSIFKEYFHKPSFGYYECLQGEGFFNYWINRLIILEEGQKNLIEIELVRKSIKRALGSEGCNIIEDIVIRSKQGFVYFILTDGREIKSEHLSDGYQRLANIVIDIAFRCAILNKSIWGEEACEKTIGTVLIDEIDLHLHPALQSKIITGLQEAFPQIQFIITTHAPMVLTGIKQTEQNIIYKLSYSKEKGYQAIPTQTYGLDASSIIELEMNQIPRDEKVENELNQLFELIDDENTIEASKLLESLKLLLGSEFPDLIRAETMIKFQQRNQDEEN